MEDQKLKHPYHRYRPWDERFFDIPGVFSNCYGFKVFSQPHPCAQWVYPQDDLNPNNLTSGFGSYTKVRELKATLKELIKYNKLKIPISKLKRNELIGLLIHTEF